MKSILKSLTIFAFILVSLSACVPSKVWVKQPLQPQTNNDGYIYVGHLLLVGEIETVHISPSNSWMEARIDTGATTSSLDARNIARFERDGKCWVRFDLVNRQNDEIQTIERPLVRNARIVQSNTKEPENRPVVLMNLTLGDVSRMVEFSLTDRQHLTYPVLIGRNVMKDMILVDVSQKHIAPAKLTAKTTRNED